MERGEDWEYEAVRRQWDILERRRQVANRLGLSFWLIMAGVLFLLLAIVPKACIGDGGIPPRCSPVTPHETEFALVVLGFLLTGIGLWFWWTSRS